MAKLGCSLCVKTAFRCFICKTCMSCSHEFVYIGGKWYKRCPDGREFLCKGPSSVALGK